MKLVRLYAVGLGFLIFCSELFASNQSKRLFIPFLDPTSQSNVTVSVSSVKTQGEPCPPEFTNSVSNTNLFTAVEQATLGDILAKYQHVTTNSGPPGTVLATLYQTNLVSPPPYWVKTNAFWTAHRTNELWVAQFFYTNSGAMEEIRFGKSITARFTDQNSNGYNVSIVRTGSGALLTFTELNHGRANGILVRFADPHPQGVDWDYQATDFSRGQLVEYMQITNGMLLGKWLMWNASSGGLILQAEAKQSYDWNNHRLSLP